MSKKINYFDLGLHRGEEIGMFLKQISSYDIPYEIFGFEAHPTYASNVEKLYEADNIHIYNYAISDKSGMAKLYLANTSLGNSIYASKNNVNVDKYFEIETISFVDWVKENVPDYESAINLLRFNIEGAELLLLNDIIDKDFTRHIDLFLGSHPGKDIKKCSEIAGEVDSFLKKLDDNGIVIYPYCFDFYSHGTTKNYDLREIFDQIKC